MKFLDRSKMLFAIFAFIPLFAFLLFLFFSQSDKLSIAFVRSDYLLNNFEGTKVARVRFSGVKENFQANLDTLSANFRLQVSRYTETSKSLSKESQNEWENRLNIQQQQIEDYSRNIEEQIRLEDEKLMQSVLNQINSFIDEYAKDKGYDIIISNAQSPIFYGAEKHDITEAVLSQINNKYKGE